MQKHQIRSQNFDVHDFGIKLVLDDCVEQYISVNLCLHVYLCIFFPSVAGLTLGDKEESRTFVCLMAAGEKEQLYMKLVCML